LESEKGQLIVPPLEAEAKKEVPDMPVGSDGIVLLTSEAGHVSVKSATAERLVERLLDPNVHGKSLLSDTQFMQAFLLNFKLIIPADRLFQHIIDNTKQQTKGAACLK
jgi:hypothetical protein